MKRGKSPVRRNVNPILIALIAVVVFIGVVLFVLVNYFPGGIPLEKMENFNLQISGNVVYGNYSLEHAARIDSVSCSEDFVGYLPDALIHSSSPTYLSLTEQGTGIVKSVLLSNGNGNLNENLTWDRGKFYVTLEDFENSNSADFPGDSMFWIGIYNAGQRGYVDLGPVAEGDDHYNGWCIPRYSNEIQDCWYQFNGFWFNDAGDCNYEGGEPPEEPVCGDGNVDAGEECDDGNLINGDGCSELCNVENTQNKNALVVDTDSNIIVMQYEPWFGPAYYDDNPNTSVGITFEFTAAKPLLQSDSMENMPGKGYDSSDPKIIRAHLEWIEDLGVEAILVDMSNGVGCQFGNGIEFCFDNSHLQKQFKTIEKNIKILYYELNKSDSNLKIIPLLGAQDSEGFATNSYGTTGVEEGFNFFLDLMNEYPNLNIIYEGKPLIVTFHGAPQNTDPNADDAWWKMAQDLFFGNGFDNYLTLRQMAGFVDDQPPIREYGSENKLSPIKKGYQFWSWWDRYNIENNYYPSYQLNSYGGIEAFTAAIASPGRNFHREGFEEHNNYVSESDCYYPFGGNTDTPISCAWGDGENYASDTSLRNNGETFKKYMDVAKELKPTFLLVHQWNQYLPTDEGFDSQTTTDIEPTDLWGWETYEVVKEELSTYRNSLSSGQEMNKSGYHSFFKEESSEEEFAAPNFLHKTVNWLKDLFD